MIARMMLTAHVLMCLYVFLSVFLRARWLDARAHGGVRLVFCILGCIALLGLAWPVARPWEPDLWSLALLGAVCMVQGVTAEKWRKGVPDQFLRCEYAPEGHKREVTQ